MSSSDNTVNSYILLTAIRSRAPRVVGGAFRALPVLVVIPRDLGEAPHARDQRAREEKDVNICDVHERVPKHARELVGQRRGRSGAVK